MDDSSGSDHEITSDENSSPTRRSHEKHSDGGESIDLNEDTDLNGQDSRGLRKILKSEVCLEFQLAQPLKLAFSLQHAAWSSPKGPGPMSDDDDNISTGPRKSQPGGKNRQPTSALLAESDSDDSGKVSTGSGPNQMPESPTQGLRRMASVPPKARRQSLTQGQHRMESVPPKSHPQSPTEGQHRMTSVPPKSHRQKAYDSEVCECIFDTSLRKF